MAYLGRVPVVGQYLKLDDLTSLFTGAQTVFNMTSAGVAVLPGTARNLMISLGGTVQEPDSAFTILGSVVTFAAPPVQSAPFFGIVLGSALDIGIPTSGISASIHVLALTQTKTANYTMTPADDLVWANGTFTVTLYTAVGNAGREIEVRNIATGTITVAGNAAELIDSTNTVPLSSGQALRARSDGTQWWKLGSSSLPPFADPNVISGSLTEW